MSSNSPQPLRPALFPRVPPFINFVPAFNPSGEIERGSQYWDQEKWDQDQFWRIPIAMGKWISQWVEMEKPAKVCERSRSSMILESPYMAREKIVRGVSEPKLWSKLKMYLELLTAERRCQQKISGDILRLGR